MMLVYRTPRSGSRASTCCAQMQRCSAIISPVRYRFVFTRAPVVSCYRGGASAAEPGATCRLTIDQTLHVTRSVSHPHQCSVYISHIYYVLACCSSDYGRLPARGIAPRWNAMLTPRKPIPSMPTSKIPRSPGIPLFSSIVDTRDCLQDGVDKAES